jgi:hypothetical protein
MLKWTDEEGHAFAEIMTVGGIKRLPAIRLYQRFQGDMRKARKYVLESATRKETVRNRFKRQLQGQNRSQANRPALEASNHAFRVDL